MEKKMERRGLGRGLSALMADVNVEAMSPEGRSGQRSDLLIPIEKIVPNPDQPRRTFDAGALEELAASISQKGVIQPLIVRRLPDTDRYEIVAGERRWRAAQMVSLHELPVLVREFSDSEVLEIAIIENVQRADLNAIDEALAYRQLMERFGHTQEKIAEALSRSRPHIANSLRLLALPADVQEMVKQGTLSAGHARALISTQNPSELARKVVGAGLSVRATEELVRKLADTPKSRRNSASRYEKDADTRALEADLSANLQMDVRINHMAAGEGGSVTITYRSLEGLDLICQALSLAPRDLAV